MMWHSTVTTILQCKRSGVFLSLRLKLGVYSFVHNVLAGMACAEIKQPSRVALKVQSPHMRCSEPDCKLVD